MQDGLLILSMILTLLRDYKPLTFFGSLGLGLVLAGAVPGTVAVMDQLRTGLVSRPGPAVLALGLILAGLAMALLGLILHTIARRFQELDLQLQALADELRPPRHSEDAAR